MTLACRSCTQPEGKKETQVNYLKMYTSAQLTEVKALPGLCAPATLTFGQDIRHPFAGESYVAFPDPLPILP